MFQLSLSRTYFFIFSDFTVELFRVGQPSTFNLNANLFLSWPEVIRRMAETLAIRLRFFVSFFRILDSFTVFPQKKNRPNFRTAKLPLVFDYEKKWRSNSFDNMGVSKNRDTPKSSILIGFSIINHPFWGTPIFGNTHIFAPLEYNPCHHGFTRGLMARILSSLASLVFFFFSGRKKGSKKAKASKSRDVFVVVFFVGLLSKW